MPNAGLLIANANERIKVLKEENEILKKALRSISNKTITEYTINTVSDQYRANTYYALAITSQKKAKEALKEVKGDK